VSIVVETSWNSEASIGNGRLSLAASDEGETCKSRDFDFNEECLRERMIRVG